MQSQLKTMAAELVGRKGEVERLREDLAAAQGESQQLRSEISQLSTQATETQKRLDAEVTHCINCSIFQEGLRNSLCFSERQVSATTVTLCFSLNKSCS